jgi:hypothetical protein
LAIVANGQTANAKAHQPVYREHRGMRFFIQMMLYDSERFWVSYYKGAAVVPAVTITIGRMK